MAVILSALRTGRALLPKNIIFLLLILISGQRLSNPCDLVQQEGLDTLKKKIFQLIVFRTLDLPARNILP
jgi:hypothetical protein